MPQYPRPPDPQPAKPDLAAVKDNALCRAYCMPEESYERAAQPVIGAHHDIVLTGTKRAFDEVDQSVGRRMNDPGLRLKIHRAAVRN
jgi:hypothetical protein